MKSSITNAVLKKRGSAFYTYIKDFAPKGWFKISFKPNILDCTMHLGFFNNGSLGQSYTFGITAKNQKIKNYFEISSDTSDLEIKVIHNGNKSKEIEIVIELVKSNQFKALLFAIYVFLSKQKLDPAYFFILIKKVFLRYRYYGFRRFLVWFFNTLFAKRHQLSETRAYESWIQVSEKIPSLKSVKTAISKFKKKPKFSIILPVYNVEEVYLRRCIDSVLNQSYSNWELCIADDASPSSHVKEVLTEYMNKYKKIKVVFRKENGHISANSNSALSVATGEFIGLLDNDDELARDALFENAKLINKHPDADMIYSDEDKISEENNRFNPHFKPDWSPDTFLSLMYTCHFGVYRKKLIDKIGGFRLGFEGAQDYDLVLRFTELTKNIYHIPKILYHWRAISTSTAVGAGAKMYAHRKSFEALKEAAERRSLDATIEPVSDLLGNYVFKYNTPQDCFVSIIIPMRDLADVTKTCIDSILKSKPKVKYEIIIIDNGSKEQESFNFFEKYTNKYYDFFRVERLDIPFNFSKLVNHGVAKAKGNMILLLNNDTQVKSKDWLDLMAGQASLPHVGAVGAKLFYPHKAIQHSGVLLGIGGVAAHAHCESPLSEIGYYGRLRLTYNFAAVTGACLMVKKSLYLKVKGFDQKNLKIAYNDIDFCLALLKFGYYNVNLPHVQLMHYESKSRGYEDNPEKLARHNKETAYFYKKWKKYIDHDPFYNENLTKVKSNFTLPEIGINEE